MRDKRESLLPVKPAESVCNLPSPFTNGIGEPLRLEGMLRGCSIFLLCGGPSLANVSSEQLCQRGVMTCALNNAATVVRPNLWVSYDPPHRFAEEIFLDPAIMKFVLTRQLDGPVHRRDTGGKLFNSGRVAADYPSVFGYVHNNRFLPECWLEEPSVNCGQVNDEPDELGLASGRSVMLAALKILFILGARKIYLLGCDFGMTSGRVNNYAFEQHCSRSVVRGNNRSYRIISARLKELRPYFERAGFEIYNCTLGSNLQIFPFLDFNQAIAAATMQFPRQIDTQGMYDQQTAKETPAS